MVWTPQVLWYNWRLGRKPDEPNARLLMAQGKYYAGRSEYKLAQWCYQQAERFSGSLTTWELQSLRNEIPPTRDEKYRDCWRPGLAATTVHFGPLGAVVAALMWAAYALVPFGATSVPAVIGQQPSAPITNPFLSATVKPPDIRYVLSDLTTIWRKVGNDYIDDGELSKFTTVTVVRTATDPNFVDVQIPGGRIVTINARHLAPGDGTKARLDWCRGEARWNIANNQVVKLARRGANKVVVSNFGDYDALSQFRASNGKIIVAFFVASHSTAVISNFPDGVYQHEFATGRGWSTSCRIFVQDMAVQQFPAAHTFRTTPRQGGLEYTEYQYTITPVVNGNIRTNTISIQDFNVDVE